MKTIKNMTKLQKVNPRLCDLDYHFMAAASYADAASSMHVNWTGLNFFDKYVTRLAARFSLINKVNSITGSPSL